MKSICQRISSCLNQAITLENECSQTGIETGFNGEQYRY